jgi:hypothetical protein
MSKDQYWRYRRDLWVHVIAWFILGGVGIFFWNELNIILKIIASIIGCLFRLTLDVFPKLFQSYESYLKDPSDNCV